MREENILLCQRTSNSSYSSSGGAETQHRCVAAWHPGTGNH